MKFTKIKLTLLLYFILQSGVVFLSAPALAQRPIATSEIGGGIGGANYKGDLAPSYKFLNNQPAATIFYRHDLSTPITLRAGLMGSHRIFEKNTIGDDNFDLPLPNFRQGNVRLSLVELSAVVEYNFLDYYDLSQKPRFSPYLFAGVAGLFYHVKTTYSNPSYADAFNQPWRPGITPTIPFGVGIKYALSKHWNLGLEFGARKVFTDKLDNVHIDGETGQDKRVANPYDKDWYFYNGISLSYTIYRINCPPTYKVNPGILD